MPERIIPFETSLSGPDGAGKDTAVEGTLEILFDEYGGQLRVVRLGRPPMYVWQDEDNIIQTKRLYNPLFVYVNKLHEVGDRQGNARVVQMANAVNVLLQGRLVKRRTTDKFQPHLSIDSRNYFTDSAVYALFYAPELVKMSMEERLRFMKKVSKMPDYDQIFLMNISPEIAHQRIQSRLKSERVKQTGQLAWSHRHETIEGLGLLVNEFEKIPGAVNNVFPETQMIIVDAERPKIEVAEHIAESIMSRLKLNSN